MNQRKNLALARISPVEFSLSFRCFPAFHLAPVRFCSEAFSCRHHSSVVCWTLARPHIGCSVLFYSPVFRRSFAFDSISLIWAIIIVSTTTTTTTIIIRKVSAPIGTGKKFPFLFGQVCVCVCSLCSLFSPFSLTTAVFSTTSSLATRNFQCTTASTGQIITVVKCHQKVDRSLTRSSFIHYFIGKFVRYFSLLF